MRWIHRRPDLRQLPRRLHRAPIFPPDLEQRLTDLAQARDTSGVHQLGKDVATGERDSLQPLERGAGFVGMAALKCPQALDLRPFFLIRGPCELNAGRLCVPEAIRVLKRVDTDDRQRTAVLEMLVLQALI